jgi:hypothetical protein
MEMTINNQCSNIKLTSPVCFIKNATYHTQFPQQVDSKSRINVNFITGIDEGTFGGALLYRLQRKDSNEPDEDTLVSTQLLVLWRCKLGSFYSFAAPIEHENTLIWNEDKLEEFYHIYDSQYDIVPLFDCKICSLNDNAALKVKCRWSHGGFKMNIIISEEEKQSLLKKPWWIDSDR